MSSELARVIGWGRLAETNNEEQGWALMSRHDARACAIAAVVMFSVSAGPGLARTLRVAAGANAEDRLQSALIDAKPGDTVRIGAGRFAISGSLSLDTRGVHVRGAGPGRTILSFDGQTSGADGLLITGDGAVIEDLAVENSKGNGIKAKGVDGIVFRRLRVEWTGGPKATNGAYGVYPVSSRNVLIEHVTVKGASDAGIYVGQSQDIVVRNSEAAFNVAGIEIENCYRADVYDNLATHNAGGVLVFDLPGLPQMGGHSIRVFHNRVLDNDTANFAPKGNIVASVPTGTGVMVMANRDVHVFDNEISGNGSAALLIVAYLNAFKDPTYNPLPRDVATYQNRIGRNGFDPKFDGGPILAKISGGSIPPTLWDGVTQYVIPGGAASMDRVRLSLKDGPVVNLNLKVQGTPVTSAQPSVSPQLVDGEMTQPAPVKLPPAMFVDKHKGHTR